jgi:hypothetical protein
VPRWVIALVVGSTVVIALVIGVLWYVIGGWPQDHDRYGSVAIPGERAVQLPEGEVRLSFEGEATAGAQSSTLEDPPEGLEVRVRRQRGEPLEVESVPRSLYSITSGDRGHEPYGKIETTASGRYSVVTSAEGASPSGRITLGPELWNPAGSRVLGALMAGLGVGALMAGVGVLLVLSLLGLPVLLLTRRKVEAVH